MVLSGLINSRAYSVWQDTLHSERGSVLFGGYDSAKYAGELALLDVQSQKDFVVALTGVELTDSSGTTFLETTYPLPVLIPALH